MIAFTLVNSPGGQDHMLVVPMTASGDPATELGKAMLDGLSNYVREHPNTSIAVGPAQGGFRTAASMSVVTRSAERLRAQKVTVAAKTARTSATPAN